LTFGLFDSLPKDVAYDLIVAMAARKSPVLNWKKIEEALDRCAGACYLRRPAVARIVQDAILFLNGKSYDVDCWVMMPNHVHLVIRLFPDQELSEIMHQLKSYTAKEANKLLQRTGAFWRREYYDRLLRRGEYERAVAYVLDNPKRAGLTSWPWVSQK
jgi:REP element-mobilizing transposase RayT